jgi:hypothetical protein
VQGYLIGPTIDRVLLRLIVLLAAGLVMMLLALGCNTSCKAMDVRGVNMQCSSGPRGYMWTGTSCIYTVACNCTGSDCQRLYATQDGCETAHVHCR